MLGHCVAAEVSVLHEWVFNASAFKGGRLQATEGGLSATSRTGIAPDRMWTQLDGQSGFTADGVGVDQLPAESLSVEALVRVDEPQEWGSLLMVSQDNGSYEKGWNLGYRKDRFAFMLSTGPKLVTLRSETAFGGTRWFHVVGTYDGATMRLYVNGVEEGASTANNGPLAYAPSAPYSMGAYHDDNEYFPMKGAIRKLRLYRGALSAQRVRQLAAEELEFVPRPLECSVPPQLRFVDASEAEVTWETATAGRGRVTYGTSPESMIATGLGAKGTRHKVRIQRLEPSARYSYRVVLESDAGVLQSAAHEFDTSLNYMPQTVADGTPSDASPRGQLVQRIVRDTGVSRGICIVYGLVDGELVRALAQRTPLRIIAISEDSTLVASVRKQLQATGLYGSRVTILGADKALAVSLTGAVANLLVSEHTAYGRPFRGDRKQVVRLLAPDGVAWFNEKAKYTRPLLAGSGRWTHQYGDLGNTADSGEALSGATKTSDMEVQWVGRPGADFGIDRNPRMPAPLAVGGRLFHQGMNRIIGLDAWNGSVLWQTEIPELRRVNIPRDASNWCADDRHLYAAINDRVWVMDQATGDRVEVLALPVKDADSHEWGFIGTGGGMLFGSAVKRSSPYTAYWSKAQWYDGRNNDATAKVCSDALFGIRRGTGALAWTYESGVIINTTICGSGDTLFFVESRHPDLRALKTGRIGDPRLWEQQYVVALDTESGAHKWERSIDTANGDVVFYMQATPKDLVLTASGGDRYTINNLSPENGAVRWTAEHKWTANNHGGHMQHPVLYDDAVYLEPYGYSLSDGSRLEKRMGGREGCHTYVGTDSALVYRGKARELCMWNRETGEVSAWKNLRPSCWLSVVPANGMVLAPEAGGGCSCGRWVESSVAFVPKASLGEAQPVAPRTTVAKPVPSSWNAASVGEDDASWPTFRHDNRRSRATRNRLPAAMKLAWTHRSPVLPSPAWTGPAKWDAFSGNRGLQSLRNIDPVFYVTSAEGRVFFGSSGDNAVHCLDAETGEQRWMYFTEGPVRLPPTWASGLLLAGSDDGFVYCVDASSGAEHWRFSPVAGARRIFNNGNPISLWPCRTGVMVEGGLAYFAGSLLPWKQSYLCAIDIRTGKAAGEGTYVRELEGLTLQGALLSSGNTLYAPQGRSAAQTFRLVDGEGQGAMKESGGVDCLLTGDGQFISGPRNQKAADDVVLSTDTSTGKALQAVKGGARLVANATHAFYQEFGDLVCVDRVRQTPLQARRAEAMAQKPRDKELISRLDGELRDCVVWRQKSELADGLALTPDHLVVGTSGRVSLLDIETGETTWSANVNGRAYGLAVAEGRLLVSTDRGEISCFTSRR